MHWEGPLAIFLAVLVSHAVPFAPLPGYLATVAYIQRHGDPTSVAMAVAATASGAALGKLAVYYLGYGIGRLVMGTELEYAAALFRRISKWGIDLAIVAFAALPLPDDVLYMPLGAARYSVRRFFLAVLAGKAVLAAGIAAYALLLGRAAEAAGFSDWTATAITVMSTAALMAVVLRIRWSSVLKAYEGGGARAAAREAVRSLLRRGRG